MIDTMDRYDEEERRMANERGPAAEASAEPEVAEVDTLIERVDLGPGCSTLVAAGDRIPAELAHLRRARRPVTGKPKSTVKP